MILKIYLKPSAKQTEVLGEFKDGLKVSVKSPPVDGKANDELVKVLSKHFGVKRSQIEIISGHSRRVKLIKIDADTL